MLSRTPFLALAVACPLWVLPHPGQAQAPGPSAPSQQPAVSMEQARRIAAENGVVRVEEISLERDEWKVEGRDSTGAVIEIKLRASDGVIIRMERERPASARADRK